MDVYLSGVKGICRKMFLLLLLFITVAVVTRRFDAVAGLLLGGITGAGYFLLLAYRIYRAADLPPAAAAPYLRAGMGLRLGFIGAMAVIGFSLPGIQAGPFVIGLLIYQTAVRMDGIKGVIKAGFAKQKREG